MTEFEKIIRHASAQRNWGMRWSLLVGLAKISIIMFPIVSFWYSFINLTHRE